MKKIIAYIKNNPTVKEIILFSIFGFIAFLSQTLTLWLFESLFKNLTTEVKLPLLAPQALGSFLAFLIANVVAKTISYITNSKSTFSSDTSNGKSIAVYTVLVILLLIIESVTGTPLGDSLYKLFGGKFSGDILNKTTALNNTFYTFCHTLSIIVLGLIDSIIIFLADKFLIMKKTAYK